MLRIEFGRIECDQISARADADYLLDTLQRALWDENKKSKVASIVAEIQGGEKKLEGLGPVFHRDCYICAGLLRPVSTT